MKNARTVLAEKGDEIVVGAPDNVLNTGYLKLGQRHARLGVEERHAVLR